MNRMLSLVLFAALFSGCASYSRVDRTTTEYRANTNDLARDAFLQRRTAELERAGSFKHDNEGNARAQAEREARARYGERTPDWEAKWSWKSGSSPAKQKSVAEELAELERAARK